ncbi:hypothetical protein HC358_04170 [Wolbachia pipientis]|uniref:Uncharacterized protein n=1 Tax=Wolbachia pipientis TaxID=955 RepID=A0A7G5CAJ8_WOLPI|nr:hypothetical protein [Wolbachia pipientis]QMV46232.1 hypothetical protein HC358_04170 [Wolbachia pipientis]
MLSNNETNSNVVEIQQLQQQNNTTLSSEDLLKHMQSLEKRIKSLEVTNRVILGLFIGTLAAAITVGAGFAIAAAPIIVGSIIGGILATAALVALSVTAYRYRAEMGRGFKYAAEKTVEGAKHIGGKIKDGAVHAKDSVKEAVSFVGQATREGTSSALRAMGGGVQKFGRKISNGGASMSNLDAIPYSIDNEGQTVVLKTEEKTRNFNSVKEMFVKEVFEDKAVNNSALTKEIFSKLGKKMLEKAYSVDGQQSAKKDQLINQLKQQADFINKLDAKKLQNLLSKDNNSLYEIFSDHHDEIKRIIGECKREYEFDQSVRRNNAKDAEERKASKSFSLSSVFSLRRKDPIQSTSSLSRSSSLDSVRTDSTVSSEAELLNPAKHKKVKQSSGFFSRFKSNEPLKEATDIKYQAFSEPDTSSRQVGESAFCVAPPKPPRSNSLNSIGTVSTATVSSSDSQNFATVRRSNSSNSLNASPKLTPVAPPKLPRSSSTDSGFNSPTSSPVRIMFTNEDGKVKTQADLRKTGSLENLVKPSSKVDEVKPESTQVKTVG